MGLLNPHLDDSALAQVWTDRTLAEHDAMRSAEKHLRVCEECRLRFADLAGWLETVAADARAEADEVFGPDRLTSQKAQILRRLEGLEHPARVLTFPHFARPLSVDRLPRQRWVAGAAAAGLVIGVALGQVFQFGFYNPDPQPQIVASAGGSAEVPRVAVQPASIPGDEAFLFDEPVAATTVRVPEALQYLNAVTPSSRDFDPQ